MPPVKALPENRPTTREKKPPLEALKARVSELEQLVAASIKEISTRTFRMLRRHSGMATSSSREEKLFRIARRSDRDVWLRRSTGLLVSQHSAHDCGSCAYKLHDCGSCAYGTLLYHDN